MTAQAGAPATGWTPASAAALIFSGLITGLLAAFYGASFALILFSGPMAGALEIGFRLGLAGTVIVCLTAALRRQYAAVLWQPQSIPVIVMGKAMAALALAIGPTDTSTLAATAIAFVGASTLLTGLVLLAVGVARVAQVARSVPYPVIGGFMATTGIYLIHNGIVIAAGHSDSQAAWLGPEAVLRWFPPMMMGAALMLIARRWRLRMVLPMGIVLYALAFYGWIAWEGIGLEAAQTAGFLVARPLSMGLAVPLSPALVGQVEWGAVAAQAPLMVTVAGLTLLGLLLNLSGIEQATGRPLDPNAELRVAGAANVVSGAIGGFVGYPSASLSLLAERLSGGQSRAVAIAAAVAAGSVAVAGPAMLGVMPRGLFAMILAFIGTDFMMTWLWDGARRMPRKDYAIVVLILLASLAFGFIAAVALGVITAAMSFTVSYSMIDAIRARTTGRFRLSTIERSESHSVAIQSRGAETAICELQGYIFFGTATSILDGLVKDLETPGSPLRNLVVDLRRVQGIDISAGNMFRRLDEACARLGVTLYLCGARASVRRTLHGATPNAQPRATLDQALVEIEEAILQEREPTQIPRPLHAAPVARLIQRAAELDVEPRIEMQTVTTGQTVLERGERDQALVILESGRLAATLPGQDGEAVVLARFLPGAIVGEIAFCTGAPRTANIVAETDCSLRRVTREALDRMAETDPATVIQFQNHLARLLALRLTRTTALVRAYDS